MKFFGLAGPTGAAGSNGAKGDQGIQGIQGIQGVQGPAGCASIYGGRRKAAMQSIASGGQNVWVRIAADEAYSIYPNVDAGFYNGSYPHDLIVPSSGIYIVSVNLSRDQASNNFDVAVRDELNNVLCRIGIWETTSLSTYYVGQTMSFCMYLAAGRRIGLWAIDTTTNNTNVDIKEVYMTLAKIS